MITRSTRAHHAGGARFVRYEPDESGRCSARLGESAFEEEIDVYYQQQQILVERLVPMVLAGEVSPLAAYMELHRMTPEDAAPRLRLRRGVVRSHMTRRGFERATVETLSRYARLFDVSVADFFQITHLAEGLAADVEHGPGRVVARLSVRTEG